MLINRSTTKIESLVTFLPSGTTKLFKNLKRTQANELPLHTSLVLLSTAKASFLFCLDIRDELRYPETEVGGRYAHCSSIVLRLRSKVL